MVCNSNRGGRGRGRKRKRKKEKGILTEIAKEGKEEEGGEEGERVGVEAAVHLDEGGGKGVGGEPTEARVEGGKEGEREGGRRGWKESMTNEEEEEGLGGAGTG